MTTKFDHVAILCTGRHTNVISVNLHPFLPVFHAWLNLTRGIEFDPPPSNWVEITGMIPNSIRQAYKCNLSEFTPNLTSISCPFEFEIRPGGTEFDPLVKLGGNHWDDTQFN